MNFSSTSPSIQGNTTRQGEDEEFRMQIVPVWYFDLLG